jgi:hypothetical protein
MPKLGKNLGYWFTSGRPDVSPVRRIRVLYLVIAGPFLVATSILLIAGLLYYAKELPASRLVLPAQEVDCDTCTLEELSESFSARRIFVDAYVNRSNDGSIPVMVLDRNHRNMSFFPMVVKEQIEKNQQVKDVVCVYEYADNDAAREEFRKLTDPGAVRRGRFILRGDALLLDEIAKSCFSGSE